MTRFRNTSGWPFSSAFVGLRVAEVSALEVADVTYGYLWPDADESTRTAIGEVIAERMDSGTATADELRTEDRG